KLATSDGWPAEVMSNDPFASRWKMMTRGPPRSSGVMTHSARPSPSRSPAATNPPNVKFASPNGSVGPSSTELSLPLTTAMTVLVPGPVTSTASSKPSALKSPVAARTSPANPPNSPAGVVAAGGVAYFPPLGTNSDAVPVADPD